MPPQPPADPAQPVVTSHPTAAAHGTAAFEEPAAAAASALGLEVLAGHGLTYVNIHPIAAIAEIAELNIGHSIVARSALVGLERAVREMIALLE